MTVQVTSAQNMERFIKIVGNSEETINTKGIQLKITLQEIEGNEYQKVREKKLDEIKAELTAALPVIGLRSQDLEEIFPPQSNYGRHKTENYTINVKDKEQAKQLYELDIKGLKLNNINYVYDTQHKIDDFAMASAAIGDAQRKAEALAQIVGKKIGKVLNIVDTSYGTIKIPENVRYETYTYKYTVTITYELLD